MPLEGAHTLSTFGAAGAVLRCGPPLISEGIRTITRIDHSNESYA